jgi:hypothetical protein
MPTPTSKKDLLAQLVEIIRHREYEMPESRYSGTGAPGIYLEDLLGLTTGNKDIPDSLGFELKFYTRKTNLITLFHKEPKPEGAVRYMVSKYGWKDEKGRLSFRHTIAGKSDRFSVVSDSGQIVIRKIGGNGLAPYWTENDILSAVGAKLRRLILVRGERKGQTVIYDRADLFQDIELNYFIWEVCGGTIKIDFDAREMTPGSNGLRNHGTKFRISPGDICKIYSKKERLG